MSAELAAGTAPRTTYWHRGATFVGRISPVGNKVTKVTGDIRSTQHPNPASLDMFLSVILVSVGAELGSYNWIFGVFCAGFKAVVRCLMNNILLFYGYSVSFWNQNVAAWLNPAWIWTPGWQMHNSRQENGATNVFISSATYNILLLRSRNIVVSVTIQSAAHSSRAV